MELAAQLTGPTTATPTTSRPAIDRGFVAVSTIALGIVALAFVYAFFMDRNAEFDELVLGNPVYMYMHSPLMTYPAHGWPDYMVVHPPTHYLVLATVMRSGLNLFHAAGVPVFLFVLLATLLVLRGGFSIDAKVGLICGLYAGTFVWGHYRPVRPDLHAVTAWFCGLVAFEHARLERWRPWLMGLGSFLVTYASGLHYPASFMFLSGVVYATWCVRDLGCRRARTRLLVMATASAAFAVPYFLLFAWPLRQEIARFIKMVQETTWTPPWTLHLKTYRAWWNSPDVPGAFHQWWNRPFVSALTAPLFALSVPATFAGPALLATFPTARGISLAALPHLLFLLIVAGGQGKNETNTGYYVAEMTIYLSGAIAIIAYAARRVTARLAPRLEGVLAAFALVTVGAAVLADIPNSMPRRFAFASSLDYEDVLRQAGRQILGPNAAIGSASPTMWYHAGADTFYFVNADLLYPPDVSAVDLKKYFSRFDGLGFAPDNSGTTWNRQRHSLTEWYTDGLLHLKGFVLAGGVLSYALTTPHARQRVIGFCYDHSAHRLWKFEETADQPNAVLVVFQGRATSIAQEPLLNDRTWGYQSFGMAGQQPASIGSDVLQIVLIPQERIAAARIALAKFRIVEEMQGTVRQEAVVTQGAEADRRSIRFPRSLAELDALLVKPAGASITLQYETLGSETRTRPDGVAMSASSIQSNLAARTRPVPLELGHMYRVSFRVHLSRGGLLINVMDHAAKRYQGQWSRRYPQKTWDESFVFVAEDAAAVLTITAYNETSQPAAFELRNLRLEPVAFE